MKSLSPSLIFPPSPTKFAHFEKMFLPKINFLPFKKGVKFDNSKKGRTCLPSGLRVGHPCPNPYLTHTLTHTLTHILTHSLTHTLAHTLTHTLTYTPMCRDTIRCRASIRLPYSIWTTFTQAIIALKKRSCDPGHTSCICINLKAETKNKGRNQEQRMMNQ